MVSASWPSYLIDRARRQPPAGCGVIAGTTPVVSFGNPLAPVATLAINPSSREFLDGSGRLLTGQKRRLATAHSLGVPLEAELDEAQARQVVDDCAAYFERTPYHWFDKLQPVLTDGLGLSYRAGGVAHLDLIQWATAPIWSGLTVDQRAVLLAEDKAFLFEQLTQPHLKLVLINGLTALRGLADAGVVTWDSGEKITSGDGPNFTFYRGENAGCLFLAWSVNIPNQQGGYKARSAVAKLVSQHGRSALAGHDTSPTGEAEPIPRGRHFQSRSELVAAFEVWLACTDRPDLGDGSTIGGSAWLSVDTSVGVMSVNADTKRESIRRVVEGYRSTDGAPWLVVTNQRGRSNRVVLDADVNAATGWYAYLRSPASSGDEVR